MGNRWIVIGTSVVAALGVLGLAIVLGPDDAEPVADAPRPEPPRAHDSDELAPGFDPDRVISRELFRESQIFDDVGAAYTIIDGDRRIVMTWDRLNPAGPGVSEVTAPRAWVFLDDQRVLHVTADRGTLVAPRNEPREGRLEGDVTLTLYDARGRDELELDTLRDVQFRAQLDHVEFDLELGHLESTGPVQLEGPRVALAGRGLSMTYNELRRRIERLEVREGELLRFARGGGDDHLPRAGRPARAQLASTGDVAPVGDAADVPGPAQFYRAVFERDVTARVGLDQLELAGDALEAIFSLDGDPTTRRRTPEDEPAATDPDDDAIAGDAARDAEEAHDPSDAAGALFTPQPEDAVVLWAGPLVMRPLDPVPADLAGPNDAMLALTGTPARARTGDAGAMSGRTIDYLASTGRLRAEGDDDHRVELAGPELGSLTATSVLVDQAHGTGHLMGPGTLRAPLDGDGEGDGDGGQTDDALTIAWGDRLDVSFYQDHEASPPRIRALRTAEFHGSVELSHPELELTAAQLAAELTAPDPEHDRPAALRRLTAAGDVRTRQPHRRVRSDHLELELAAATAADANAASAREEMPTRVERMIATGNVRAEIDDPATELIGERLVADVAANEVRLFGSAHHGDGDGAADADEPTLARVVREREVLAGEEVLLRQGEAGEHALAVAGRGWLDAQLASDDPADDLRVAWTRAMSYVDGPGPGTAQFLGEVRADTRDGDTRATLTTDDLQLRLAAASDPVPHGRDAPGDPGPAATGRRIQTAAATGPTTRFTAERIDAETGAMLTKLRIDGERIDFDGDIDRVHVPVPGSMFIQDHRPPPAARDADAPPADAGNDASDNVEPDAEPGPLAGMRFSGRGDTLFTWAGSLTLDGAANEVVMVDEVQMVHEPAGERVRARDGGEPRLVQFDAQRALARFASAGGLAGWGGGDGAGDGESRREGAAPEPVLELIRAAGAVRVIVPGERVAHADHLQYTRSDQRVVLWADEGGMVRIERGGDPAGVSARHVKWDLTRDRIDATELGPGIVPLPE